MPNPEELQESLKALSRINALTIDHNEYIPKLNELGADLCRRLNHKAYCIFKRFKWYLLASVFILVGCYFAYNYFENKPECEEFPSEEKLSILMAPDEDEDFEKLEKVVFAGLEPYQPYIKSMKGKYYTLGMTDLEELAKHCGPSIMIKGNANSCCMTTFDPAIEKYIFDNYSIHPSQFSKCNTSLEKLSCVINTFLSEKNNNNNVFSNPTCIQHQFKEITLKSEIKDTLDMMLGQSMANMYEKKGKLDSAMIILEKLSLTGGVNPDTVYSRMSRIATKTKNTSAEIIAKTGLIKLADKKGDQNTKEELEKDIKVLNTKLNIEQGKVQSISSSNIRSLVTSSGNRTPSNTISNVRPNQTQQTSASSTATQLNPVASSSDIDRARIYAPIINTTSNVKLYENLNRLIMNSNYKEIERVYQRHKERIDKDTAMLSLYYESMYKAKAISDSVIPEKIIFINQRLKTAVFTNKIKKEF
jgi:hypothetical protein